MNANKDKQVWFGKYNMKRIVFSFLLVLSLSSPALADEFGDRFYNQTPAGLGDYTMPEEGIPMVSIDDIAQDLQDVMPAAGEEAPGVSEADEIEETVKP